MLQTAKLLDESRSRAVAIMLRSLHCQMTDIERAVYGLEFTQLDVDSLWAIYQLRATNDELKKIQTHLQNNPAGWYNQQYMLAAFTEA